MTHLTILVGGDICPFEFGLTATSPSSCRLKHDYLSVEYRQKGKDAE
jgi:hypothetical protein